MGIIWTIIIGFIAGVVAKFLMPGKNEPSGFIMTVYHTDKTTPKMIEQIARSKIQRSNSYTNYAARLASPKKTPTPYNTRLKRAAPRKEN